MNREKRRAGMIVVGLAVVIFGGFVYYSNTNMRASADALSLIHIYIYFQIPLATLLLIPAFDALKREWREAAALLGGGAAAFWLRVGLPNLLPSLLGTFSILFANAIAAFATAYALMQNNFQLLPIRISEQFVGDVVQRKEFGSALAVVLMLMMVAAIAANGVILKKRGGRG